MKRRDAGVDGVVVVVVVLCLNLFNILLLSDWDVSRSPSKQSSSNRDRSSSRPIAFHVIIDVFSRNC